MGCPEGGGKFWRGPGPPQDAETRTKSVRIWSLLTSMSGLGIVRGRRL